MTPSSPNEAALSADRCFRLFENEHLTLVRIDVAPWRDEHVNGLASRLSEIAGHAAGRVTLDLSVVEDYSWPWIRSIIDLAAICNSMGGELKIQGMNEEGKRLLKANRTLQRPVPSYSRRPEPQSLHPPPASAYQPRSQERGPTKLRAA